MSRRQSRFTGGSNLLSEFPKPSPYTIHLKDGRTLINFFVTDASARRWASISHLSNQIVRVVRDASFVVFSVDETEDNSPI